MNPLTIAAISCACVFGAALLGVLLRRAIPEEHLSDEAKDVVKLSMGLVATMTALVLGLLVASTKDAYDTKKTETLQMAARIAYLNRTLENYGNETAEARRLLHEVVERMIAKLWPDAGSTPILRDDPSGFRSSRLFDSIEKLAATTELQRSLKSQALTATADLGQMRWLLSEQGGSSISTPLLVIVVSWLALLFLSFALFAPPNPIVFISLLVASLSVSGGILLVLELDRPFDGFIKISSEPMRHTLSYLVP